MSETVDPADVADESVVEQATEQAEEQASESASGFVSDNPLLSTEPNPPIGDVAGEHDVGRWAAYIIRAGYKLTGTAATPAIADALFGTVLGVRKHADLGELGNSDSNGTDGAEDVEVVE